MNTFAFIAVHTAVPPLAVSALCLLAASFLGAFK
jgi:hypothetical protein